MTEITVTKPPATGGRALRVHWGEMGTAWGVNRSVAQIHALLYLSDEPLTADDIADQLAMARSNVSISLRELLGWSLIRRVHAMGDRRDYYEAEADMFEMVRRIAQGRKAREIDPALSGAARVRIRGESRPARLGRAHASGSPPCWSSPRPSTAASARSSGCRRSTLMALIKMGGAVARLATRGKKKPRKAGVRDGCRGSAHRGGDPTH